MLTQHARLFGSVVGVFAAGALLAGCGEQQAAEDHSQHQTQSAEPQNTARMKQTAATLQPYQQGATSATYNPEQVPAGAKIEVSSGKTGAETQVALKVEGLQPNRDYGAHVHTKACGPTGDDAGPHYQEKADPVKPSVDPAFANPQNEVWLDLHTDAQGNGTATAKGTWALDTRPDAQSVVIHESHTHSEPGKAGTAGGRLACISVDF